MAIRLSKYSGAAVVIALSIAGSTKGYAAQEKPDTNASGDANSKKAYSDRLPLPIRIIQDKNETADTKARADRAEKREDDQIAAQRAATKASWVQTIFGLLSIGLVTFTLHYTRKTANAAAASAGHSAESAIASARSADTAEKAYEWTIKSFRLSVRPLIAVEKFEASYHLDAAYWTPDRSEARGPATSFKILYRNKGNSMARRLMTASAYHVTDVGSDPDWSFVVLSDPTVVEAQGNRTTPPLVISSEIHDAVFRREVDLHLYFKAVYYDELAGANHITTAVSTVFIQTPFEKSHANPSDANIMFGVSAGSEMT